MSDTNKRQETLSLGRLKKNFQFQRVYRQGRSLSTPKTILFYKRNGDKVNNLGISISKKVGNSVQRHRLKRVYREAFLKLKGEMKEGYDFIIVARRGTGQISFHEAVTDLWKILSRGKLIK